MNLKHGIRDEALMRGDMLIVRAVDQSWALTAALASMKDHHIEALANGAAKTRGRAFFAHPKAMIALREEAKRRRTQKGN
jgi:hypothetical protein